MIRPTWLRHFVTRGRSCMAVLLLVASAPLAAQQLTGTVRDSVSNLRIRGAVLQAMDASGTAVASTTSDERGTYRLILTPKAVRVRVVRIGFRPRDLALSSIANSNGQLDIGMLRIPSMLESVRVTDNARCERRPDRAAALGLWEQARAGLLASVIAREGRTATMQVITYDRIFDIPDSPEERLQVQSATEDRAGTFRAAMSAADFVKTGFSSDSAGTTTYFGPDAEVLLGEGFTSGYCFRLMSPDPKRPSQVGLGFSPADSRRGRIDIDGALWIDTTARELRDITYRYAGLPRATDVFEPGGKIEFRQMKNGTLLIDRWFLRLVGARRDTLQGGNGTVRLRTRLFASESGGELAHASWPDGTRFDAALGTLRIRATNKGGAPAVNTLLDLPGTSYRAITDSAGVAEFRDLVPGPYTVRVRDDRLGMIGVTLDPKIKFRAARDSVHNVTVQLPSAEDYVIARCVEAKQWQIKDSVFIVGRTLTRASEAIAELEVKFEIGDGVKWQIIPDYYVTGTDGLFQSCARELTPGMFVRIRATWQGQQVGEEIRALDRSVIVVPMYPGEKKP